MVTFLVNGAKCPKTESDNYRTPKETKQLRGAPNAIETSQSVPFIVKKLVKCRLK